MVKTVIIDGQIIMRDREILTVDESKIRRDVVAAGNNWMARAGIDVENAWPIF